MSCWLAMALTAHAQMNEQERKVALALEFQKLRAAQHGVVDASAHESCAAGRHQVCPQLAALEPDHCSDIR